MARVIKQGRCSFAVFSPHSGHSEKDGAATGENFNSLAGLVPEGKGVHGGCQGQEDGAAEQAAGVLGDAMENAERIVSGAEKRAAEIRQEAEKLIAAARKNAEQIESQAYNLGYEQGTKDGEELGRRQFEVGLQHLEKFLENFKEQTAGLSSSYEAQMLQVCLIVARKIIEKEITEDQDLIARVLVRAMDRTIEGSSITVHMNPRDFENLCEDFLSRLSTPGGNKVELKPDAKVNRGGCMIETDFGLVDASIESRWQCLLDEIEGQLFERTGVELQRELRKINGTGMEKEGKA